MSGSGEARARILARIREALEASGDRPEAPHPGPLPPPVQAPSWASEPVEAFRRRFEASGGEVVRLGNEEAAAAWLSSFVAGFEGAAVAPSVPEGLRPRLPDLSPEEAPLGVSMAVGAAAQTGSLLLTSREGRRHQLLPPTHLVWVRAADVATTLGEALERVRGDLPALLALHSAPSKSADIGQILVRGVHGPGRLVAGVLGE